VARAFVGLGSNLGDRSATLTRAIELLGQREGIEVVAVSAFHETEPVGYLDQPAFLNAAVAIETQLQPEALLVELLSVERELGRTREGPRYGPRTVDLDLLLLEGVVIDEPGLTVPHPRLHERAFALAPLVELDPSLVVPGRGSVVELLRVVQAHNHLESSP
jgi:2-amino-4-hydroxy-6-hydroxymethyldihydropteridine diphosphokinase